MIKTFADKALENCWKYGDCSKFKPEIKRRVLMKLDSMDAAVCLDDLKNPPGNRLHSLHRDFDGYYAISVNGPWRLIFSFFENNIYDVKLEQYH